MSTLTEKIVNQLRRNYQQPLLKNQSQGIWYTGADLLEDLTLCRTSLQQQALQPGQAILISTTNLAPIPLLLLASWQLGLTVTLTPPTTEEPKLPLKRYAAMAYSAPQTLQLMQQIDPQQVSHLTLLLNTAPDFAYFVHDLAPTAMITSPTALILPHHQVRLSQDDLLTAVTAQTWPATISNLYDLKNGILPLLANLLNPTPFSLATAV